MKLNTLLTLLLFVSLSAPALAGHPHRDRGPSGPHIWAVEYAETALRQAREARRSGCAFSGNRWSMNYRDHYEWALRKERRKGLVEIDRRDEALRNCQARHGRSYGPEHENRGGNRGRHDQQRESRGHSGHHGNRASGVPDRSYLWRLGNEPFARWYADTAVAQSEENRIYGCGNGGGNGRWRGEWNAHYRFARQVSRDTAIREAELRDDQLSYCGRRG